MAITGTIECNKITCFGIKQSYRDFAMVVKDKTRVYRIKKTRSRTKTTDDILTYF